MAIGLRGAVQDRDVDAPVAVEIAGATACGSRPTKRRIGVPNLPGAGAGQDLDHAGSLVGIDQIHLAVAIEVLGQRWPGDAFQLVGGRRVELVAVAEQDG